MSETTTSVLPWLLGAGVGVCIALAAWLAMQSLHAVPADVRKPLQLRLPLWWRLMWPLAAAGAWYGRPLLTWRRRRALELRLRRAGLHHLLTPVQVLGAQLSGGLVVAVLAVQMWWMTIGVPNTISALGLAAIGFAAGACMPALWLRDQIALRRRQVVRTLPFVLDMTTLCVEGGLNLQGALQQAVHKGPAGPLREELQRALGDIRAGMRRADALRQFAQRLDEPAVKTWVSALIQAESLGMNLAPILRAQADQRRAERFLLAEKLALQAPVKMLFPLIAFIFPCTFMVLAFPIAMKLMELAS
nr:type II secretion system F family protein [Pseudomonas sp.]